MTEQHDRGRKIEPDVRGTHDLTITDATLYGRPAPMFLRYSVASGEHRGHRFEVDLGGATVIITMEHEGTTVRTMTINLGSLVEPALDVMINDWESEV